MGWRRLLVVPVVGVKHLFRSGVRQETTTQDGKCLGFQSRSLSRAKDDWAKLKLENTYQEKGSENDAVLVLSNLAYVLLF